MKNYKIKEHGTLYKVVELENLKDLVDFFNFDENDHDKGAMERCHKKLYNRIKRIKNLKLIIHDISYKQGSYSHHYTYYKYGKKHNEHRTACQTIASELSEGPYSGAYFLNGKYIEKEEWLNIKRTKLIDKILI